MDVLALDSEKHVCNSPAGMALVPKSQETRCWNISRRQSVMVAVRPKGRKYSRDRAWMASYMFHGVFCH